MNGLPSKMLLILLCSLLAAGLGGCAGKTYRIGKTVIWPIGGPISDEVPGVIPTQKRIEQLRAQAATASKLAPQQQEQISVELAQRFADESDPLLRAEILRTLAKFPTSTATAKLRAALSDSDSDVRMAACQAWAQRGSPEAASVLAETLHRDSDLDVRLEAARALGKTRDPAAVAALGLALEEKDVAMQRRAVESLREVTGKDLGNDVDRWRQYVKGEAPENPPTSIAERFWRLF